MVDYFVESQTENLVWIKNKVHQNIICFLDTVGNVLISSECTFLSCPYCTSQHSALRTSETMTPERKDRLFISVLNFNPKRAAQAECPHHHQRRKGSWWRAIYTNLPTVQKNMVNPLLKWFLLANEARFCPRPTPTPQTDHFYLKTLIQRVLWSKHLWTKVLYARKVLPSKIGLYLQILFFYLKNTYKWMKSCSPNATGLCLSCGIISITNTVIWKSAHSSETHHLQAHIL